MDIKTFVLTPPVAFILVFIAAMLLTWGLSKLSYKPQKQPSKEAETSYACGEDVKTSRIQPDYGQFFPFAFFFTIMHVVALIVTTVPVQTMQSLSIAVIYIAGAIIGLFILFRR